MKIFLHVGASKCASSSIQQHFSYNHTQGSFAYACADVSGALITGNLVELRAVQSNVGYASSYEKLFNKGDKIKASIDNCAKNYDTILLSCEGWCFNAENFAKIEDVFSGHEVEILFIIRPPVQWYNSAWWQWFNWDKSYNSIEDWLPQSFKSIENPSVWIDNYNSFAQIPFVNKMHLLCMQSNILEQIYDIIGLGYTKLSHTHYNASASAEHLQFLSMNKYLRNPHQSAVNFILGRNFIKRSATPWALSSDNISLILEKTRLNSKELAKYINNEDILENPLWWEISAYEEKIASFSRDEVLPEAMIIELLDEANAAIHKLEKEVNDRSNMDLLVEAYKKIENLDHLQRAKERQEFIDKHSDLKELFK